MSQGYSQIASPPIGISGNQLVTLINTNTQAIITKSSGNTAPVSPQTYQDWIDTSVSPNIWKVYDGTDWIIVGYLDVTNNRFIPSFDPTNVQSGTTYTFLTTDRKKLVTFNNASSIAATLPQAGANFPDGWEVCVRNIGAGTVTVTPTTSTINGGANISVPQGSFAYIRSDGTNYHAFIVAATNLTVSTFTQAFTGTDNTTGISPEKLSSFWKKGSDIASAATLVRPADANIGLYHEITGTTGISALWSSEPGQRMFWFRFQGALTLTHNGTSFILLGSANITTAAGDFACFIHIGSNNWRMINYIRASGAALLNPVLGLQSRWIPASEWVPRITAGARRGVRETATNDIMVDYLAFSTSIQEGATTIWTPPKQWDNGTITITPYWTSEGGTVTETMELEFAGVAISNDDPLDAAFGTAQPSSDALLAVGDVHIGPTTAAITIAGTPADADLIALRVVRDVTTDTLSVDAQFLGCFVHYTINAGNDS